MTVMTSCVMMTLIGDGGENVDGDDGMVMSVMMVSMVLLLACRKSTITFLKS